MAAQRASSPLGYLIRRVVLAAILTSLALPIGTATAHTPSEVGYVWTCSKGKGEQAFGGYCYRHHSYANARIHLVNQASWSSAWQTAVATGYQAWDKTNGHQFDYIVQSTNTSSNSDVSVVTTACGVSSYAGCAVVIASGQHIVEKDSYVQFKNATTVNKANLAIHEFGHLLGLGHSSNSSAVMWWQGGSRTSLHLDDRNGRCNIYGHSHGWWGGCSHGAI